MSTQRRSRFGDWASKVTGCAENEVNEVRQAGAARERRETDSILIGAPPIDPNGPGWFRVVYESSVRIRKYPDADASPVGFLYRGDIVEASHVEKGWAALTSHERESRDISEDCGAWVMISGEAMNLGLLLQSYTPQWFTVLLEPMVPVRKFARTDSPMVASLNFGEVFEVATFRGGWVALSQNERDARDISKDCGAWVLVDGKEKGLGRLLKACPPPAKALKAKLEAMDHAYPEPMNAMVGA